MGMKFESRTAQADSHIDVVNDIVNTRLRAMARLPFMFSELAGLHIIINTQIPTIGITLDYKRLVVNPNFWRKLMSHSIDDRLAILLHEALHKILKHSERSEGKILELWNIACDAVINKIIEAKFGKTNYIIVNGITVEGLYDMIRQYLGDKIPGWLTLEAMKKMNEEELYYLLVSLSSKSADANRDLRKLGEKVKDIGIPEEDAEVGKVGEVKPLAETGERSITEVVGKIKEELKRAQLVGTEPGGIEEIIDSLIPRSKVNWRTLLSQILIRESGRSVVQTWKRPSRRYAGLPGTKRLGPKPLKTLFLVDVSGSIDSETLKTFIEESMGAVTDAGIDPHQCYIVFWDVGVREVIPLPRVLEAGEVRVTGRGGTVIDDALKRAIEEKPDVVAVLTDGMIATSKDTKYLADELRNTAKSSVFVYTVEVPSEFKDWIQVKYNP